MNTKQVTLFENININEIEDKLCEKYNFDTELEEYIINLNVRNYSKNTIKTYRSILKRFIYNLKNDKVKDDKSEFVKWFEKYIQNIDASNNYKYLMIVVIQKFIKKIGILYLSDFGNVRTTKSVPHPLTENEIQSLINTIKYDDRVDSKYVIETKMRNRLIIKTLYTTGLRVSELCSIKVNDVDLYNCKIKVIGKGNKERIVIFDKVTSSDIQEYLSKRITKSEYLFPNTKSNIDKPLTTRSVQSIVKECGKNAGLKKKITPHSLRHSFATNLLHKGMNIYYIKQLMGHESIATTQCYIKTELSDIEYEYNRLI